MTNMHVICLLIVNTVGACRPLRIMVTTFAERIFFFFCAGGGGAGGQGGEGIHKANKNFVKHQ